MTSYQEAENYVLEPLEKLYTCPHCSGLGEYLAEYIGGYPRYEHCDMCKSIGRLNGHLLGIALNILKKAKQRKKL